MAEIQFVRGENETTIPDVRLTRAKDGTNGRAYFYIDNPKILEGNLEILGMYMIDEEGELVSRDVNDKFINMVTQEFTIDYFQFPMIDNTRLSNDMRCAVVMRDFSFPNFVEVDILYFPGSHSSLKEKPYYDDVVKKLLMDKEGN